MAWSFDDSGFGYLLDDAYNRLGYVYQPSWGVMNTSGGAVPQNIIDSLPDSYMTNTYQGEGATGSPYAVPITNRTAGDYLEYSRPKGGDAFGDMLVPLAMAATGYLSGGFGLPELFGGAGGGAGYSVGAADAIPELGLIADPYTANLAISQGIPAEFLSGTFGLPYSGPLNPTNASGVEETINVDPTKLTMVDGAMSESTGWWDTINQFLKDNPLALPIGGALLGGLAGSSTPQQSGTTTTTQSNIPPDLMPYLTGQGGLFSGAQSLFNGMTGGGAYNQLYSGLQSMGLVPGSSTTGGGGGGLSGLGEQQMSNTLSGNYMLPQTWNPYGNSFTPFTDNPYLGAQTQAIGNPFLGQTTPWATNGYIGLQTAQASNPYLGQTVGQASNPYIGQMTGMANNPWIGQTSPALSNSQNPYFGQTTQVGTNPYLGMNNPYLEGAIDKTLGDVTSRVNTQFSNPNAWGGSANQEVLQRSLADASNQMRYQDYGLQAQLGESDVARRLQAALTDMARNTGIAETTRTGNQQAALADLARNSSLYQQLALANQGTQLADITRNAQLAQQLGMFNIGTQQADLSRNAQLAQQLGLANQQTSLADLARNAQLMQQLGMFNSGLSQTDLARNAQLAQQLGQFNANLYQTDLARNSQLAQQQGQFNANLYQGDLSRNAGLWSTDQARNDQNYQMERNRMFGAATGLPDWTTSWTNSQFAPYNQYANLFKGWGGTSSQPYYTNPMGSAFGGALAGFGMGTMGMNSFKPNTSAWTY